MKRRDLLGLLGSAAMVWPLAAHAQASAIPVVGFLSSGVPAPWTPFVAAFRQGLNDAGYVEGKNVTIEFRWAEGHYDRLPTLASDLVRRQVAVLVATGGNAPALAAKAATAKIPIVFLSGGGDPVKAGVVTSLNRPGGNVTGVNLILTALVPKLLELLHQLVPKATMISALVNPNLADVDLQRRELQEAAEAIKQQIHVVNASTERDIDAAFATLVQQKTDALLVANDPFFVSRRDQIVALAARYAIPAIYSEREYTAAGGLMSYGASITDAFRQAGMYAGRILKGAKPDDLPVEQSSRFELVINIKTANALGITIPQSLLLRADEVIQ